MKNKNLKDIKKSGFEVPKDYFQEFDTSLMRQINLKEKIKDSGYKIPKRYFENFDHQILNKIPSQKNGKIISLFSRKNMVYITGTAAAILLLFSLTLFNTTNANNTLAFETIEEYILDETFANDELAYLFDDTDIIEDDFNVINFSNEDIETYVNDNLEINDLYIE